jgi:tRNA(adenine34) deaminase
METFSDEYFMRIALNEAQQAYDVDEVPIGAIIVCGNRIIGRGHNLTERLHDVTAHAEMQAITAAANFLGAKYLIDCTLYVTIEPCPMCAGALYWSQITKLVIGAKDSKKGFTKLQNNLLHPKTELSFGILESECGALMTSFFQSKRSK